MRTLGRCITVALSLILLGAAAAAGVATVADEGPTAAQCRRQWAGTAQTHGENGNPGGSTTVLRDEWDRRYDRARRLARYAGRDDCGDRLRVFDRAWNGLESLQYDLQNFNMPYLLSYAEGDRRHWKRLQREYGRSDRLPEDLKAAFRTARREAPLAAADLAPVLTGAGDVDVADWRSRREFEREVATVASQSQHLAVCQAALDLIAEAELDEE